MKISQDWAEEFQEASKEKMPQDTELAKNTFLLLHSNGKLTVTPPCLVLVNLQHSTLALRAFIVPCSSLWTLLLSFLPDPHAGSGKCYPG